MTGPLSDGYTVRASQQMTSLRTWSINEQRGLSESLKYVN